MTLDESYKVIGFLVDAYRDDWSTGRVQLWARLLADLPYQAAAAAVLDWCSTEKWPPRGVAEIRERVLAVQGAALPSAEQAWGEVREQISACGMMSGWTDWSSTGLRSREPRFSHPCIADAVTHLGWDELCLSENQIADRAHFFKLYAHALERHRHGGLQHPGVPAMAHAVTGPVGELASRLRLDDRA